MKRFALALIGLLLVTNVSIADETADPYAKRSTWSETMLATRANVLAKMANQGESELTLGAWSITAPIPGTFDGTTIAEVFFNPTAKDDAGAPLWKLGAYADGQVHMLPGRDQASTYLHRIITAPEDMELPCGFGSDDGLIVFFNGERILAADVPRGPGVDQNTATLQLKKGANHLLLKIYNRSGGHGFYFSADGVTTDSMLDRTAQRIQSDFPVAGRYFFTNLDGQRWLSDPDADAILPNGVAALIDSMDESSGFLNDQLLLLAAAHIPTNDPRWLALFENAAHAASLPEELKRLNLPALRMAIEDLRDEFGPQYPNSSEYLAQLELLEVQLTAVSESPDVALQIAEIVNKIEALRRESLLANPLFDFDSLLLVKRGASSPKLGLPQNWQGNCALAKTGYDNEIAVLSPVAPDGTIQTLYRPEGGAGNAFVGDVDLHFDGDRMIFSMPSENGYWQIYEVGADGENFRQVTTGRIAETTHNYDAIYMPNEKIIFGSTACQHGVPCVGGGNTVANLYVMGSEGENIRQLCFDQDHDWTPAMLNNGRVLYTRWEYSDSPHYFTRLLMQMNPDGTNQMEFYGSNSVWPNSFFYAKPVPGSSTKIAAIISGHHGVPRMGELILFDAAKGRFEADGVVQRIPGYGEPVEPVIADQLVNSSWPKFLHPHPLSEKYFLVSAQMNANANWGIYLVDVFDNMLLIREEPGYVLFEPLPLKATPRPPLIPDRVTPGSTEAVVMLTDVYFGPGMKDVPRGAVKSLRVFEQHYAYPGMGGHINVGIDGPWDVKRILGTVPVEEDGSASFVVPANTPLAVQPLDENGRALQVMRSWFTAQPGERLSCVGCHEPTNFTPQARVTTAMRRLPSAIEPWYGPTRGFAFAREVQPVLDEYCIGCHDGSKPTRPDLRLDGLAEFRNFTPSYVALHPFVRRPGPESDYHLQFPMEWHASTSELVQMLEKGHNGVQLDEEAWNRIITWIDLNVPDKGTWTEHRDILGGRHDLRTELRDLYANVAEDPESILETSIEAPVPFVHPTAAPERLPITTNLTAWPFSVEDAAQRVLDASNESQPEAIVFDLADGVQMRLALIPQGEFVMGSVDGAADEYPQSIVSIETPLYMGVAEVTNAQFACYDAAHDSGVISMSNKDQGSRGYPVNNPNQPVVRITWNQAMGFCEWLSEKTGRTVTLPTESQWEWACRAGTETPFHYGTLDNDFSMFANLADATNAQLGRRDSPKWHPRDDRFNDGKYISADVGARQANAFGLYDMHGNVAEWTRSSYHAYPFDENDGTSVDAKSVRGGSWYDRPMRATSSYRMRYEPWQRVYNVGFRVIVE
jgi:formylglycine-generating enzyme required for sulfatase activity